MIIIPKEKFNESRALKEGKDVVDNLKNITVGIAGLGGLGSNIIMMLARIGVEKFVIADKDIVEMTNLNRQNYYVRHIGQRKTDATEELLHELSPHISIEKHFITLNKNNLGDIFRDCDIVCEAFDSANEKAMLITTIMSEHPDITVISGSGMAGYGSSNDMRVEHPLEKLYICGDGIDLEDKGSIIMAPRVNICAGMIANTVVALVMKGDI